MSYNIKFSSKSKKFLKNIDNSLAIRIIEKIELLKENPFRYLGHFEGETCYKLCIGDYRALIDIDFENKILVVQVLDKRGRVYKR